MPFHPLTLSVELWNDPNHIPQSRLRTEVLAQAQEAASLRAELKKMDACWSLGHKHQENYIASLRQRLEEADKKIRELEEWCDKNGI